MRRDAFRERLFFLLVLAGALLLLSGLMLRQESAALSTRTFRDGFIVAKDVMRRRTEIVVTSNASSGSATKLPPTEDLIDDDTVDIRTMTVKTEDGDEITIKRPATSKGNKVTTIFRDEKGKLTIEDTPAEEIQREETYIEAEKREEHNTLDNINHLHPERQSPGVETQL
ncbi:unnamed protein product [Peronospora farinosa]|uniref:Secreted protein n=1 Tax=Peronospora farinosa TaxID=134698 RepID=A0AAV0TW34_9STRA|nr:unnamed protein product [Peronospora farinosa]CAI5727213.1 unnamed protein product [Peronospora farinosa]